MVARGSCGPRCIKLADIVGSLWFMRNRRGQDRGEGLRCERFFVPIASALFAFQSSVFFRGSYSGKHHP
jgi:hypothetical protein